MHAPVVIPADPWIAHLDKQIEILRSRDEPDAVHQLRVGAGRLSVWLELQGRRALRDDLRWLRRSATELRDLDVLLLRDRSEEWNDMLISRRGEALSQVRAAFLSPRLESLQLGLACVPPPAEPIAARGLARIQKRVLRAGERLARNEKDATALHRLRRRVRRLRYAFDWMQLDSTEIKSLQDALGKYNDLVVELRHLAELGESRASLKHKRDVEDELERARRDALGLWREIQPHLSVGASQGD
jgi:CHAD domain-containing protein